MSEFWARKVATFFDKIDVNHDGVISKKDAEEMAQHLADAENSSPEQREQIREDFTEIWRKSMKSAGSDDNGLLTAPIMVASFDQQRNDPAFKEAFVKTFRTFFSVRDVNGDGFLSEEEYAAPFAEIGIKDTKFLHNAYISMDSNKDGKVDLAEYTSALWKYLLTEDKHLLWGPLVHLSRHTNAYAI